MKPQFKYTKLSVKARFLLAGFCYLAAAMLHLVLLRSDSAATAVCCLGIFLLAFPLFFLAARNFTTKPVIKGEGEWKQVTVTELDRLKDHIKRLRQKPAPLGYGNDLLIFLSLIAGTAGVIALLFRSRAAAFIIADLYLIFVPSLWFLRIKKWYPPKIINGLKDFRDVISFQFPKGIKLIPSFYLAQDENGDSFPLELKLTAEPSPKPDDLIGAQFQLAHNKGPNGTVPYMYAVFITKGRGHTWQALRDMRFANFITEADRSIEGGIEYGTVVLRQDTEYRSDGYHTKPGDIDTLLNYTVSALMSVKGE